MWSLVLAISSGLLIGCSAPATTNAPSVAESPTAAAEPQGSDTAEPPSKAYPLGTKFTCPMHLEVVSDKPGRCPKCDMFLEPVASPSTEGK